MTKADIIDIVYEEMGLAKRESAILVEKMFDIIKETLEQGENVKISGFGSFNLQNKSPRQGRNPQTGEQITVSARRVLSFKPSNVLRNKLNA